MARPVQRIYLGMFAGGLALALLMGAVGLWIGLWLSSRRPTRIAAVPPAASPGTKEAPQGPPGARVPSGPTRLPRSTKTTRAPAASGRTLAGRAPAAPRRASARPAGKPAITASHAATPAARRPPFRMARATAPQGTLVAVNHRARVPGSSSAVKAAREEIGRPPARVRPAHPRRPARRGRNLRRPPQMLYGEGTGMGLASTTIPRETEPLMLRALGAYYVTDEEAFGDLRRRGWSFADMAVAGNLAARSRRPLSRIVRAYQDRHDWVAVAREVNVAPDEIYLALNGPRAVLVSEVATGETPARRTAPQGSARRRPARARTPAQRVAGARLELVPRHPAVLLRRVVANYYALPPATLRDLEARGWTLGDMLVAANLTYRSEASFEEVAALRDAGREWPAIAQRVGVAPGEIYQPAIARRVTTRP